MRCISVAIIFALMIAGCVSPATVTPGEGLQTPYPALTEPALTSAGAYPPVDRETVMEVPYPAIENDGELSWIQAEALIQVGEVVKVLQTHDGQAWLILKDGRRLHTLQPHIDMLLQVIKNCGDPCKDIRIATE